MFLSQFCIQFTTQMYKIKKVILMQNQFYLSSLRCTSYLFNYL